MKIDDPWMGLQRSKIDSSLVGHLVMESRPHEVFRARDTSGRRILFLVHDAAHSIDLGLPRMAGLHVEVRPRMDDDRAALIVRLENGEDAEIFSRFCDDIVATVAGAETEVEAVQAFIRRTWKWHALLKGSRKEVLSREAQLGLIGELHTLVSVIAPVKGLGVALEGWQGSGGAPKDFEIAGLCIECKAQGASSRDKVRITSEHQLADIAGQSLVLLVHVFATAGKGDIGKIELHGAVSSLRAAVSSQRPDLVAMLDAKLDDAGYEPEHDYDVSVIHRSTRAFLVAEGFPRIVPGTYPDGPSEISYDLPMNALAGFQIDRVELERSILSAGD